MSSASTAATRDGYGNALKKLAKENPNVVVLDAGVADSTRTEWFKELAPERFFEMGISEGDMICTAAGLATCGKIPFATSFIAFLLGRTMDQINVSVCYSDANVKIVGTHGGIAIGEDGPTAQAIADLSWMRALPNMTVIAPADAVEAEQATLAAAAHDGPVYLRLGRPNTKILFDDSYQFRIGKGHVMKDGSDAVIFAHGIMVQEALEAAESLKLDGKDVAVVNISTIKPLDAELVAAYAEKCGHVITAEDHNVIGGLGSAVSEVLAERAVAAKLLRIGVQDQYAESGPQQELFDKYGLCAEKVAQRVKDFLQ